MTALRVDIRIAAADEYDAVRAAYLAWGYPGTALATDRIFVARLDGAIAGLVRRTSEHGVTMLRGMHIQPSLQRNGIGSHLLRAFDADLAGAECTCTPYAHLESFYGTIGFARADEESAAPFLRDRLAAYRREGRDMILMHRAATAGRVSDSG